MAISGIDLAVLIGYLIFVTALSAWIGIGIKNLDAYLLGDRGLPWYAVMGSIVATETSTVTFLSVPGIAFAKGGDYRFLQLTLGYLIGRILIVRIFLPLYFRGELYSAYEVLNKRFGGWTRSIASLIFLFTRNLGDGLRLFLTAIVLQKVADIPLGICIVLIGLTTIGYTLLGGIKAVVWNDCIQFVVYVVGGLLALAIICMRLPEGWSTLVTYGTAEGKFQLFDWHASLTEPYTFWTAVIGGCVMALGTHGTDQMLVQRFLCARSQRDAGIALVGSGLVVMLQFALFLTVGVGLSAFYSQYPPASPFEKNDEVLATFIITEMPAGIGVVGLLLAAVFAAAMSTLSSSINSSAASALNDLAPFGPTKRSDKQQMRLASRLTVFFGIIQIVIGYGASFVSDSVITEALMVAGFAAGLLLGVFLLGVAFRDVDEAAAVTGLLAGLIVLLTVAFIIPTLSETLSRPAWPLWPVIGASATVFFGWATSKLRSPL